MWDGVLTRRAETEQRHSGIMSRLDHRGHGPVARWSADAASQQQAERVFAEHLGKGYTMYNISEGDGVLLKEFDPTATEILAVPRMQAG